MPESFDEPDPLEQLAEEFVGRLRLGEHPTITEYVARLPSREDEIRNMFSALMMLEELRPVLTENPRTGISLADPQQIGEFRILKRLGIGGMGVVYEAVQESLGRHVALKLLPVEAAGDPERLDRFRREAKAATRLHHTNIVPVFGTGMADGRHYYAMQFIAGHPLSTLINEVRRLKKAPETVDSPRTQAARGLLSGNFSHAASNAERSDTIRESHAEGAKVPLVEPVSNSSHSNGGRIYWTTVARFGAQLADALSYAHGQDVIHRDIKPSNLLLDQFGMIWITDFGLAKIKESADITQAGDIIGTLRYMAPERFDGAGDHRVDVYSLGLTLYEMLTLKPAFQAQTQAGLIELVIAANPPKPRTIDPLIPKDLETVVLKAIARDPALRYSSAAEMADDLRRYVEDRPVKARRATATEQAWRWCRRNPAVASLMATVMFLMMALAIGAALAASRFQQQAEVAVQARRDGDRKLFTSYLSDATATTASGQAGRRFLALEKVQQALALGDRIEITADDLLAARNAATAALCQADLCPGPPWNIDNPPAEATPEFVRFSRALNFAKTRGKLDSFWSAVSSADGRFVMIYTQRPAPGVNTPFQIWRIDGPEPVCVINEPDGLFESAFAFSPNGEQFASGRIGQVIRIFSTRDGKRLSEFTSNAGAFMLRLRWHQNGHFLAVIGGPLTRIWDTRTNPPVLWAELPTTRSDGDLAFHPDGRSVVTVEEDAIRIWEARTSRIVRQWPWKDASGGRIALNRAGDRLVGAGWSANPKLWDTATGRELTSIHHSGIVEFSADDRHCGIGEHGDAFHVTRIAAGRELRILNPTQLNEQLRDGRMAFHPSGRLAAVGVPDGVVFFDVQNGLATASTFKIRRTGTQMCFDPTGAFWTVAGDVGRPNATILYWPVLVDPAQPHRFRIGPPEAVSEQMYAGEHFSISDDGRYLGLPKSNLGAIRVDRGPPLRVQVFGPQNDVRTAFVSPDGRRITLKSHHLRSSDDTETQIWDAEHQKLLAVIPRMHVRTDESSDGRWLYTSYGADSTNRRWDLTRVDEHFVPAWEPASPRSPGGTSPDGRIVASAPRRGYIILREATTDRELVRLPFPDPAGYTAWWWSERGEKLTVIGLADKNCYHYDLRLIRQGLAELGLDWDHPPVVPAPAEPDPHAPPLEVTVVGAEDAENRAAVFAAMLRNAMLTLTHDPLNSDARYRLGMYLFYAGRNQDAWDQLTAAAALGTRVSNQLRIAVAQRLNRPEDVLTAANAWLAENPHDLYSGTIRAECLEQLHRTTEAVAEYSRILTLEPKSSILRLKRAFCYDALGEVTSAATDKSEASKYVADAALELHAWAWRLANGPLQERDLPKSLELARVMARAPQPDANLQNTIGCVYYRNELYTEAITILEKNLSVGGGAQDAINRFIISACHHRLGHLDKAREYFEHADRWITSQPNNASDAYAELRAFRAEVEALFQQSR